MTVIKKKIPSLSDNEIERCYYEASKNHRKRYPKILHVNGDYNNRVFNFLIKDTYMQPHIHPSNEKIEKAGFKANRDLSTGIKELIKALPLLKRTQFANI